MVTYVFRGRKIAATSGLALEFSPSHGRKCKGERARRGLKATNCFNFSAVCADNSYVKVFAGIDFDNPEEKNEDRGGCTLPKSF